MCKECDLTGRETARAVRGENPSSHKIVRHVDNRPVVVIVVARWCTSWQGLKVARECAGYGGRKRRTWGAGEKRGKTAGKPEDVPAAPPGATGAGAGVGREAPTHAGLGLQV